ncbi:MAG: twin-arginine translocase TatA/TatE family subunit [Geobacter sp.]|jgi:sec-independent protein translocase protein TatA|nr:twin-arginine translocase TatA/TatE family subunit [Geobacter sp.]
MFGFGLPELIVIGVILLVIFGPGKLPELGNSLGKAIKGFKEGSEGKDEKQIKDSAEKTE